MKEIDKGLRCEYHYFGNDGRCKYCGVMQNIKHGILILGEENLVYTEEDLDRYSNQKIRAERLATSWADTKEPLSKECKSVS